ncbi:MAG: pilin [Candidatus Omnitrophica bacterium]|nr:pilin [Candidatus Omnitrophota bacterium]
MANKSGFTLIEIVVVLVIVGILAGIALPNLFQNISKSKAAQALVLLDSDKSIMESYYAIHSTQTPNPGDTDLDAAGATTSAAVSNVTFNSTISNGSGTFARGNLTYQLISFWSIDASKLILTRETDGSWQCSTLGGPGYSAAFKGIC